MELCIWFENGAVAYFTDVKDLVIRTDIIEFQYFGRRSQKEKRARFSASKLAGYSFFQEQTNANR